jgi:DNA-binding transcriptional ArsR family regulator
MNMTERIDQIKALSSEVRIEILQLLDEPEVNFSHQESASPEDLGVCINLISERLRLSQPTTSRHIDLLRRAGFLRIRRQQKWSYCSRDEENLANYYNWLQGQLNIKSA